MADGDDGTGNCKIIGRKLLKRFEATLLNQFKKEKFPRILLFIPDLYGHITLKSDKALLMSLHRLILILQIYR